MNNNLIVQSIKIDKNTLSCLGSKEQYLEWKKSLLNEELSNHIEKKFPIREEDINNNLELRRELFIFSREELIEFINEIKPKNTHEDYEV